MSRIEFLAAFFCMLVSVVSYADWMEYSSCGSIQEVIVRETQEISLSHSADRDELAELYVSRGESYLLNGDYEKAVEDFTNAHLHLEYSRDVNATSIVAFRAAFGEVVSYDNLGVRGCAQEALEKLQVLVEHVGGNDCSEYHPCQGMATPEGTELDFSHVIRPVDSAIAFGDTILNCKKKKDEESKKKKKRDKYSDILGPDEPPHSDWCREVVAGTGKSMRAIAFLAFDRAVRESLLQVVEAFERKAFECCSARKFWKACVAPIARKWKEWKDNNEEGILPNEQHLPLYID